MQLTNFRMSILSPLEDIDYCCGKTLLRMDYLVIDGCDCFNILWNDGVFDIINKACGSAIDEHEEECLKPDQINKAIVSLSKINKNLLHVYTQAFIDKLINLLTSAKNRGTSVYFVL